MTGSFAPAELAFVQTFKYRQSSLIPGESGRSMAAFGGNRCFDDRCMQTCPYLSALRTPVHFATGCGSFQRSGPTGGAANGTPLKTRTPSCSVPESWPASVLTVSLIAACIDAEADTATAKRRTGKVRFI